MKRWYIAAEALLFAAIQLCQRYASAKTLGMVEFSAVALNAAMVLWAILAKKKVKEMIAAALLFTCLGDVFLTLKDTDYITGVIFFCIVQTIYTLDLMPLWPYVFLRVFIAATLILLIKPFSILTCAASYSFAFLLMNVFDAVMLKRDRLYRLGLILFLLCDLTVGIYQLFGRAGWLIWIFYLPSQVFLTLYCLGG